jgi:putative ABC transport system substrate-binding protein
MFSMRRRDFITLLGGAAASPLTARAQQGEQMRRIGLLAGATEEHDPQSQARIMAFRHGLEALGWILLIGRQDAMAAAKTNQADRQSLQFQVWSLARPAIISIASTRAIGVTLSNVPAR